MAANETFDKRPRHQAAPAGDTGPVNSSAATNDERQELYASFMRGAQELIDQLRQREGEFLTLMRVTERVSQGVMLPQVLESLYDEMRKIIPYNRIGCSLIDQDRGVVVAHWASSDRAIRLKKGYEAHLAGSSLERIIETMQPRIINDLEAYLAEHPDSRSTRLIVKEGMRSSLTCPLIIQGKPVGFVFFTSAEKNTYSNVHVTFFQQIAGQLSTMVEKGRLYSELAEQKATVEQQNLAMTRELAMARQVQQALIPERDVEVSGLEIAFRYEPATQVGGDILDVVQLPRSKALLFVGDAMGHGVQAALVMSVVKAALHSAIQADPRPSAVLGHVNKTVCRLFADHFVTAACCLVDSGTGDVELSLAGQAGPLWFQAKSGSVAQDTSSSVLALGISEITEYESASITMQEADMLVFATDGIVEAFSPMENQYGEERLKNQVLQLGKASAGELCSGILQDLEAHCQERPRNDDLTLLAVKFAG
ncbi:MAG: PP2C family protein-serine/threonine phosphatase [Planctomycetota bacterium]|jgi:serine phosphatase RsbU (regulator of sigma subunit)